MEKGTFRLGCDIGGTFTDFVLINDETGFISVHKCLTTPKNPSDAVEIGIENLKKQVPNFENFVTEFIHGTTLVINAIIERKGAKTGLITTKGFRDVLELGRELRYDSYDIFSEYPEPLVPRFLRKEVTERVCSDGEILIPLNVHEIENIISYFKTVGVESIAICLINSYKNYTHESKIKEIVEKIAPDLFISTSHEVLPQIREYERTSTTVTNAYVKPITAEYLKNLSQRLSSLGLKNKIFIMLSSGSITTIDVASSFPVRIIESGPTAAVIASQYYCRLFDIKDMFCFDMGGTTAKSCLLQNGEAGLVSTFEIGRVHRFKKGSGLPIQVPVVDLLEIGAGGGSIARINKMGLLQVGPDSSGADPGPACYGLGGINPTVTDADLLLGYLNPDYFLGGKMPLDLEASREAIKKKIAEPLGLSVTKAAFGIHDLVNETMATAAKTHIAEKGGNPNIVTIAAFGGAGPVHAYGLGHKIRAPQIVIPPMAGVGSALGFFTAPIAFDVARSYKVTLEESDLSIIEKLFLELEQEAETIVRQSESTEPIEFFRSVNMRFQGQGSETNLNIPNTPINKWYKSKIRLLFDRRYEQLYGRTYSDTQLEFVTFKVRAVLPTKPFNLAKNKLTTSCNKNCLKGYRKAYSMIQEKHIEYVVFDRTKLAAKTIINGPAIIEEKESTIVLGENAIATTDNYGFVWIKIDHKSNN